MTVAAPAPYREPMAPTPLTVAAVTREVADVVTLECRADYPFAPGQFSMLTAWGVGEAAISISGDPARTGLVRHTIRAVGPVSARLAAAEPGSLIGIRGPFGTPWPLDQAAGRDVVVMAGGLGLAPLRPLILRLIAECHRFGTITLLYGTRNPALILFATDLLGWGQKIATHVTVDQADPTWAGEVGVVPQLIERARFDAANTTAFICGPEVMMRFSAMALCEAGVAGERIFLSMERHMKCGIGHCGRCQFGPFLLCRDGPVFSYADTRPLLAIREL